MKGMLKVSLAGPAGNFILAFLFAIIIRILIFLNMDRQIILYIFRGFFYTIMLGVFNLIPIPPLDGSKILRYFLRGPAAYYFDRFENFGVFILLILLLFDQFKFILYILFKLCASLFIGQMAL
jgi:Zn-dependent protease